MKQKRQFFFILVLLLPVLPLKNMLPAVYLRMAEEKNDAEA